MNTKYETENLLLYVCSGQHASLVTDFYIRNFNEFSRYEPLSPQAKTVSYHKKNLEYEFNLFSRGEFVRFHIFEKKNPVSIIGTVSYRDITHFYYECCTIGYKMDKDYRRRGYAKETLSFCDRLIFNELGINRIEATIRTDNIPSMRLLESIGYTNEGLLRQKIKINGTFADHYMYSLLRSDLQRL